MCTKFCKKVGKMTAETCGYCIWRCNSEPKMSFFGGSSSGMGTVSVESDEHMDGLQPVETMNL